MNKNTSISLGEYFESFVRNSISNGRFKNASEVIRAGLRLLEDEESRAIALRSAIQEGIKSGPSKDFDSDEYLKALKNNKG